MPVKQRSVATKSKAALASETATVGRGKVTSAPKTKAARRPRPDTIDVFIRMNEDPNKDYCFNVPTDVPLSWLDKIFETLPIILSPSYFFNSKPEAYGLSVHPGYLTAQGGILFSDKAHHEKWIRRVPRDAKIGDVVTEGQLIVPQWKPSYGRQFRVLLALAVWLYLDLPEFISPTPGTAPSYLIFWISDFFFEAPREPKGMSVFSNHWWQLGFFTLHIIKVMLVYLFLWNGFWHPATMNPFRGSKYRAHAKRTPTSDELNEIGWTGARRCGVLEWSERYIDYVTKKVGGIIEAHRQGYLTKAVGLKLDVDEGWNVLKDKTLDEVTVEEDLLDASGKFVVSVPYFQELAKPIMRYLQNPETTSKEELSMLKEFRETGGMNASDFMLEFFQDMVDHDEREYGGKHVDIVGK